MSPEQIKIMHEYHQQRFINWCYHRDDIEDIDRKENTYTVLLNNGMNEIGQFNLDTGSWTWHKRWSDRKPCHK